MKVEKEEERPILFKRIFPPEKLLEAGKQVGDLYCAKFDERGYDKDYKRFNEEEIIVRLSKALSDQQILESSLKYRDDLYPYWDFLGNYYTYDRKTKSLRLGSEWEELEKNLDQFFEEFGEQGEAVLRAIWEANVKLNKTYDNWFIVLRLARKRGLKKGWLMILADLEIMGVIRRHKGDLGVPEELLPLVEKVLQKQKVRETD